MCCSLYEKPGRDKGLKTIINISSGAAHSTIFGWSAYSSSKAGLEQFTKTAAMEQQDTSYPVSVYAFSRALLIPLCRNRSGQLVKTTFVIWNI
ncbi:SDR family NAD(P)-dependent oxidoreductase [Sinobaca sp. H24]|uniref:SDR family NAD(P)-dependent oxidoreductase n=1 Tax=Sinobaca sp. H24 TaxID=2923376 RepID=UPI0035B3D4A0